MLAGVKNAHQKPVVDSELQHKKQVHGYQTSGTVQSCTSSCVK